MAAAAERRLARERRIEAQLREKAESLAREEEERQRAEQLARETALQQRREERRLARLVSDWYVVLLLLQHTCSGVLSPVVSGLKFVIMAVPSSLSWSNWLSWSSHGCPSPVLVLLIQSWLSWSSHCSSPVTVLI